ncbi:TPA: HPr(Ser) kinase/phosphatase [Candidatus Sumerlaeota bacterium]|jgi:HPr kinase/phosphorylase|nr:HPr(Ser) kinase/phosphatase [Candidatus Sumerlaeota bacterium]
MLTKPISVRRVLEKCGADLKIELLTNDAGLDNTFSTSELNRPGMALTGYYDVFSADRIQVLGLTEVSYLRALKPKDRVRRLQRIFEFYIPCIVITTSLEAPEELIQVALENRVPVLRTPLLTSNFSGRLSHFLERELAPSWAVHGVMVDVFGMGVLIQGRSGVGKSECALELVERGHRLIADDIVILRRVGNDQLLGMCSERLRYHMEIRGIGIIDIESMYGVRSIRDEEVVSLRIRLERWDPKKDYERLGIRQTFAKLFDCDIPEYVLPVEPGRNISILVEVAALMQRLRQAGINPAASLNERIMATMRTQRANLAAAAAIASPSTATVLQAAEAIRAADRTDAAHLPPNPELDGHIPEHEENLGSEML